MNQVPFRLVIIVVAIVLIVAASPMLIGINDAGHRTVVQYPSGTLYVRFDPGLYLQWFGKITEYNDVITMDFDKEPAVTDSSIDRRGIAVRYQDGGTGTVFGKARFTLPTDELTMLKVHRDFRSNEGVANKMIVSVAEEGMNLTAGLMSSEAAYAEKRGIFTQWSHDQIANGKFQTELRETTETEEATGKKITKSIPVIKYGDDGQPLRFESDFKIYGITVTGFQITDWDFEPKTLEQIAKKRESTMQIITAKAQAEAAKQEAMTAEEKGKADVMTAKYQKEVEKIQAVVQAEQAQEVAVIAAKQKVDVAEQTKLEAEQLKLAANEYKEEQILRGEGDGEYKRLVLQADGALEQKLATYTQVMGQFATAFGQQKWVPEVQMVGGSAGNQPGNEAANLINLLTAKTLQDLGLDLSVPKGGQPAPQP